MPQFPPMAVVTPILSMEVIMLGIRRSRTRIIGVLVHVDVDEARTDIFSDGVQNNVGLGLVLHGGQDLSVLKEEVVPGMNMVGRIDNGAVFDQGSHAAASLNCSATPG